MQGFFHLLWAKRKIMNHLVVNEAERRNLQWTKTH